MTQKIDNPPFQDVLQERLSRRKTLKVALALSIETALGPYRLFAQDAPVPKQRISAPALNFQEIEHAFDETHHVAAGYDAEVLIRWGDPVTGDAPPFDPDRQNAESQAKQFGYNNDFIGFVSLPLGSNNSDHGLLCVNHEYTNAPLMLPGYEDYWQSFQSLSKGDMEIELAAHGHSVIEVKKNSGKWEVLNDSSYNRRITATTVMEVTGPVAGHKRLRTSADPSGRRVLGTLCNCAGAVTPWGTVLFAEEDISDYFVGDISSLSGAAAAEVPNYQSMRSKYGGFTAEYKGTLPYGWYQHDDRFDINKEPLEFNRFGWMVEFDPYDPDSIPRKRTALGRFMHEGASIVTEEGKAVVAYMGDDGRFEFIYKFISRNSYRAGDREHNLTLLEDGDLYVARINPDGTGQWIELAFTGQFEGTSAGHITSQEDMLIEARNASRVLGATAMDRPEDIETDPLTGRTYVMLTNNSTREDAQTDPANPRAKNEWGHILELMAPGEDGARDHWSTEFQWDLFLLAGDPSHPDPKKRGRFHPSISEQGWFSCPDNLSFDPQGRMWIASDGGNRKEMADGSFVPFHDGLWCCETTGDRRALTRHFFGCPRGAEMTGPCFTPDGKTLFVSVQHPGVEAGASFASPPTRWPDFSDTIPPRPSVMAITKKDGGIIGGE